MIELSSLILLDAIKDLTVLNVDSAVNDIDSAVNDK